MQDECALKLWGLFSSAFISSTVAPGGSEGVLAWLVSQNVISVPLLLAIATLGNTLGALTTFALGKLAKKGSQSRFRRPHSKYTAALLRVERWGVPALIFSWLPVVGDALCFAAGWLELPALRSTLAILVGKFARYAAVAYVFL